MKIDASNINFSATHKYHCKKEITFEREMKFETLFDSRAGQLTSRSGSFLPRPGDIRGWFSPALVNGNNALEMSQDFIAELEKLRQMMRAIFDRLDHTGFSGSFNMAGFGSVGIQPVNTRSYYYAGYEYLEKTTVSYREQETASFFVDGEVHTADGSSVDFSFEMTMEREYFREDQFMMMQKGYVMIDPLIISLEGAAPRLSDARIDFDMDMDGEDERLLIPGAGVGFLSLDKNNDGIINNGSELFGPSTGNGFKELAAYDTDRNSWIDENDPVFDELMLWAGDEHGQMKLTRIKDAGIGAVYLESTPTPFDLKDGNNRLLARIKNSSVALNEDGSVSSVQEMDWTA